MTAVAIAAHNVIYTKKSHKVLVIMKMTLLKILDSVNISSWLDNYTLKTDYWLSNDSLHY